MNYITMVGVFLIGLSLGGMIASCESITNSEIISMTRFCEAEGLEAKPLTNGYGKIVDIQCTPRAKGD